MLKAVVFDFDGVIVDSEPVHYRAFLRAAQGIGVQFDYAQYLERYVGFDDRDGFRAILLDSKKPVARRAHDDATIAELCRLKADAFQQIIAEGIEPIPGVIGLIHGLHPDTPIALASGATRQDIEPILLKLGLAGRFDPIVTADDVPRSKPDPMTYALAVQGLARRKPASGIQPQHCLAIEDTPAGIESANRAGLMTLGLATTHDADRLRDAHRVVTRLEGLTASQLHQWFD